jgi:mitogen-activated protein kinase 15
MYMLELGEHDNIVKMVNCMKAENDKDIYLVFEYMDCDLYAVGRAGILEDIHKTYITYQILKALNYIHSGGLIHRDLKPSNVLISSDCHVKICDFGLCRSITDTAATSRESSAFLTDYVATRWYRAPEILLGSNRYTGAVDMWGLGCILGELLNGKPIFQGTSTMDQLDKILSLTGQPLDEDIQGTDSPFAATMLETIQFKPPNSLSEMFPTASAQALDFIRCCLQFNPHKRITAEEGLAHPFVSGFHNPDDEPVCPHLVKLKLDDTTKLTAPEYREALYKEMLAQQKKKGGNQALI